MFKMVHVYLCGDIDKNKNLGKHYRVLHWTLY
jgi:hypothetical protein